MGREGTLPGRKHFYAIQPEVTIGEIAGDIKSNVNVWRKLGSKVAQFLAK